MVLVFALTLAVCGQLVMSVICGTLALYAFVFGYRAAAVQVASELRSRGSASWIDSLRESDLMSSVTGPDRLVLLGRVGFDEDQLASHESTPLVQRDPQPILERFHQWWCRNRMMNSRITRSESTTTVERFLVR